MTVHISARLAWHDSGWNGHICSDPKANTYCVGQYSFPGDTIATTRQTEWEQDNARKPCSSLNQIPPCVYSVNAFGTNSLQSYSKPPDWFRDGTEVKTWTLKPSTVATWPYEEMYRDEVLSSQPKSQKYDPVLRRQRANEYFGKITPERSLVFYYANYSNPFSENDQHRYVVVGVGRIKSIGAELTWTNQSPEMERKYGPNTWARDVTSAYPNEGLRIPYHAYMDQPEILERILFVPENSRHFKYATRHISDDGALGLIERLVEIIGVLSELEDKTENWEQRQEWLASVMAELWQNRGLYPGILRVWDYLKFTEAIGFTMDQTRASGEQALKEELFSLVRGDKDSVAGLPLTSARLGQVRKRWKLLEPAQQTLLQDVLPRFDLQTRQIQRILDKPGDVSILASHLEIVNNPYILAEQYIGDTPDDQITFSQIDHGMLPSPDLGAGPGTEPDDWPRLRALCVEQLQHSEGHTFLPVDQVLDGVNRKLSFMPEWKRAQFTVRHVEVEEDNLQDALSYRREADKLHLYLRPVFEDERAVEQILRQMAARNELQLRFPVTDGNWTNYLTKPESSLAKFHPADYDSAIAQQVAACQKVFRRPLSVICGAAGTGKTTIVEAIIKAVEKGYGAGTTFRLLAPTGKAADQLRERTKKEAETIHSFLARRGWLNDNLTLKRDGGQREDAITTYVIDESSMLDLPLLATVFRAINWNSVQRLIFVGDPNQLPPIGTGKVFADLIDWLKEEMPESVGELETNMRQIENRLVGRGTGILDLANVFIRRPIAEQKSGDVDAQEEEVLARVREGGDLTGDLRVLYWNGTENLERVLLETIVADMEQDCGEKLDTQRPDRLWDSFLKIGDGAAEPERSQVITPYRGDLVGIEHLNRVLQNHKNRWMVSNKGTLSGVTYRDKVIQIRNRPQSNPIWAFNTGTRKKERVQVYNGEIGVTRVHGFDSDRWKWGRFRLAQFQVVFSRKESLWVEYASEWEVTDNLELAYAISVHKSQGSEFQRVYFVLPKHRRALLSKELFYTGLTRAQTHCTLLIEEDMAPILSLRRPESSHLLRINSSLFRFRPAPREFQTMFDWYKEGKIHRTLAEYMVRSKSEVIIANILFDRDIPFEYEMPLVAPDGTAYLPDFTINWRGEAWYWEHEGMLHDKRYRNHQQAKHDWYKKHGFADHLIVTTEEGGFDSTRVRGVIDQRFGN